MTLDQLKPSDTFIVGHETPPLDNRAADFETLIARSIPASRDEILSSYRVSGQLTEMRCGSCQRKLLEATTPMGLNISVRCKRCKTQNRIVSVSPEKK